MSKEYEARKRAYCTENGLCHMCGTKMIGESYYCFACNQKMSVYRAAEYRRLREEGRCVACKCVLNKKDRVPLNGGTEPPSQCSRCKAKAKKRRQERKKLNAE